MGGLEIEINQTGGRIQGAGGKVRAIVTISRRGQGSSPQRRGSASSSCSDVFLVARSLKKKGEKPAKKRIGKKTGMLQNFFFFLDSKSFRRTELEMSKEKKKRLVGGVGSNGPRASTLLKWGSI